MALHHLLLLATISSPLLLAQEQAPAQEDLIPAKHVPLLGGWFQISVDSPAVQEAAKAAMEKLNANAKANKYFRLVNITSAEYQVTNTITYKLEATVGKTKCMKHESVDLETCDLGKKRLMCTFDVEFFSRDNQYKATSTSCKK